MPRIAGLRGGRVRGRGSLSSARCPEQGGVPASLPSDAGLLTGTGRRPGSGPSRSLPPHAPLAVLSSEQPDLPVKKAPPWLPGTAEDTSRKEAVAPRACAVTPAPAAPLPPHIPVPASCLRARLSQRRHRASRRAMVCLLPSPRAQAAPHGGRPAPLQPEGPHRSSGKP